MSQSKKKQKKTKQKSKLKKKRRSLHRKHKLRRKKDRIMGMPFIIGFQGDPATPFWCNMRSFRNSWELIPRYYWRPVLRPFSRLSKFLKHKIMSIALYRGKTLIDKAPQQERL